VTGVQTCALPIFKEAIIFAYLAALKIQNRYNSLASVTGAQQNMIGGVVHDPGF
jgi:1,6-anhydro-N-acetylmuramate kinase